MVDDEDYEYLNQFKWHIDENHGCFYASRNIPLGNKKRTIVSMHRIIMGAKKGEFIDHRDRNGLNNQKSNLRFANPSQNGANTNSRKNSTSKYLGVSWHIRDLIWNAAMTFNGKSIHIGYFDTEIEAALAYNKKAIELHGEFANLNIIENEITKSIN